MRVLLIEDDRRISDFVVKGLTENGFSVSLATSGEDARQLIIHNEWDIILMDIMLPGIDGIQLTKMIRYKRNTTPIIILSALGETEDKIQALNEGADDYLSKPFHFQELIARIKALTRRAKFNFEEPTTIYSINHITIKPNEHRVLKDDIEIELSPKEYKLLLFLVENKNKVLSRTQILNAVWGLNFNNHTNVVDVYVSYLRNKLDDNRKQSLIQTIKGVGYSLRTG